VESVSSKGQAGFTLFNASRYFLKTHIW